MNKGNFNKIPKITLVLLFTVLVIATSSASVNIRSISFEEGQYFKGSLVKGKMILENTKSEQAFFLEYTVNGRNYKQGNVIWLPEDVQSVKNFYLEVPEDYDQRYLDVRFKVYNDRYSDTKSKTLLISNKEKSFHASLTEDELFVSAGEEEELEVQVLNTGNQRDSYVLSLKGWKSYEFSEKKFELDPGEMKNVSLDVLAPEEKRAGKRVLDVEVCGVEKCSVKSFDFYIDKPEEEQNIVKANFSKRVKFSELEDMEFSANLTNIGAGEKTYTHEFEGNSSLFEASYDEFSLSVNETDDFDITITPKENQSFNVTYALYSQGEKIFQHEFRFDYEGEGRGSLITGAFVGGDGDPDLFILLLIYAFAAVGFLALLWNAYSIYNRYRFENEIDLFNKTLKR